MSSFKRRVPAAAAAGVGQAPSIPSAPLSSSASSSSAGPSNSHSSLPTGVRPSATSSLPQPLLSTGVAALDDLVAGRGIPSGTTLLILPEDYTQPLTTARASTSAAPLDPWTLAAAEPYADLVLAYGIAQGIAHQHTNVVIGEQISAFCQSLMARIGDEDGAGPSQSTPTSTSSAQHPTPAAPSASSEDEKLRIAFRYANLPVINAAGADDSDESSTSSTVPNNTPAKNEFPSTFDLSRRISPRVLEKARADSLLHCIDLEPGLLSAEDASSACDRAWSAVQEVVARVRSAADRSDGAAVPVLRIHIRGLGSPAWHDSRSGADPAASLRLVLRIKALIRSLSVPPAPGMHAHPASAGPSAPGISTPSPTLIPAIATFTVSHHALLPHSHLSHSHSHQPTHIDLAHRLSSLADTALALSSFDARPSLRNLLAPPPATASTATTKSAKRGGSKGKSVHGYTGALRVLRSASGVGGWSNEVVRASVLRGMSSAGTAAAAAGGGSGPSGAASGGGGGSGGAGENDLAFRVGRKRLTVELLNVDDIGLARREEEAAAAVTASAGGMGAAGSGGEGESFLRKMEEFQIKEEEVRASRQRGIPTPAAPTLAPPTADATAAATMTTTLALRAPAQPTSTGSAGGPKLGGGGLASLRARGLARAAAAASTSSSPTSSPGATASTRPRPVSVELEGQRSGRGATGPSGDPRGGGAGAGRTPARKPVVFEKRPDQLEF
ncbi:hypothetical protein V8E36_002741 [Tilletia maclaganii]